MTNAMIINTSFPAAKTESPRNEKMVVFQFGDLLCYTRHLSCSSTDTGFKIQETIIALIIFSGIAVNTSSPGIICTSAQLLLKLNS